MWHRLVPRVDAGDILGGGIDVVESAVASIHEACGRSTDLIASEPMDDSGGEGQFREVDENVGSCNGDWLWSHECQKQAERPSEKVYAGICVCLCDEYDPII